MFPNSNDVVSAVVVEVAPLLVDEVLKFVVDKVASILLIFLWNTCYHVVNVDHRGW